MHCWNLTPEVLTEARISEFYPVLPLKVALSSTVDAIQKCSKKKNKLKLKNHIQKSKLSLIM